MAYNRQRVRFYTDVMEGYTPNCVSWTGIQVYEDGQLASVPPEVTSGYKRIWIEVEMPSDSDLWAERFDGFFIGGLNPNGQRRALQIDNIETGQNRPAQPEAVAQEEPRPRRRMSDGDRNSTI